MEREFGRQMFHIAIGFVTIAILMLFGREVAMAAVFAVLMIGTVLINARMRDIPIPIIGQLEKRFEREGAPVPGWGSACYAAGALITITFLGDMNQICATVLILSIGDSISTLAGSRFGKTRMPHNPRKTLEGSIAFFFAALTAGYFIGPAAIPLALVAAIAETAPFVDDNLTIPIACVAFFLVAA